MSQPHFFEFNNDEYTVADPADSDSWVEALRPFINEFASEHYATRWQGDRDGLGTKDLQKVAEAVPRAMQEFRALTDEQRATTTFRDTLGSVLTEAFEDSDGDDCQWDALHEAGFYHFQEELMDVLAEVEGPVAGDEEIWDALRDAVTEKMWELDDSEIFDMVGNPEIPLSFSPLYRATHKPGRAYDLDDLLLYPESFGQHGPSVEIDGLAKLLRMNLRALMPLMKIDYKDDDKIRAWMKHTFEVEADLPPVITKDQLEDLLENCGSNYVYPEWIGCLGLDELSRLDPCKPMKLTQGVIGFMDVVNGAGHFVELDDKAFVIVQPDQCLSEEPGRYSLYEITGDRPDATIKNCDVEAIKAEYREFLSIKTRRDIEFSPT